MRGAVAGAIALIVTVVSCGASAEPVFLQGATSATITDVLPPRAQGSTCCSGCAGNDACPDCACWATSMGMLLAYWDDYTSGLDGPWERLLPGGDAADDDAYRDCTQGLFDIYGGESCGGTRGVMFLLYCSEDRSILSSYTDGLGYDFSVDADDWVWWGTDVTDEIDAGRPVYYGYYPEGSGGHAVLVVGYDDLDESLWLYNTWDYAAHIKGFDEATDHCTLNVTPGGRDCDTGLCCDGGYFMAEGTVCQTNAGSERGCPWGTGCGDDAGERRQDRTCTGESSGCDGLLIPSGDWNVVQDCLPTEVCFEGDGSCRSDDSCGGSCECAAGPCCDGCHYLAATEVCDDDPLATEFRCDGDCGGYAQRRQLLAHCTGTSAECGSDNPVYEEWQDVVQCGPDELCVSDESRVSCSACSEGCRDGVCLGCTPDCNGRECGFDGCGGTCGVCSDGEHCTAEGRCEAEVGPSSPPPDDGGCSCRLAGRRHAMAGVLELATSL